MILRVFFVFIVFSSSVFAGEKSQEIANLDSKFFSEADFGAEFLKQIGGKPLQEHFSWRGSLWIETALYKKDPQSLWFKVGFQTVGGHPTEFRINTSANNFLLEMRYERDIFREIKISFGMTHLSTHVTKELIFAAQKAKMRGGEIQFPGLDKLFNDFNIPFVQIEKSFSVGGLRPKAVLRFQPSDLRLRGGHEWYDQPVYLYVNTPLLSSGKIKVSFENFHEFGNNRLHELTGRIGFFSNGDDSDGRLQFFSGYSPGVGVRVNTRQGLHHQGFFSGIRFSFSVR